MDQTRKKQPAMDNNNYYRSTIQLSNKDQLNKISLSSIDKGTQKEYNPYDHRQLEHPNTFAGAIIHVLKGSLGTGILSIPRAFKNAGLLVGLIGTALIGLLCTYTVHLLVAASLETCVQLKRPSLGFAETAVEVFKNGPQKLRRWAVVIKSFIDWALLLGNYVGGAVSVVLVTESVTKFLGFYYEDAESYHYYIILVVMALLIICCQIRELKHLVPFSFISNSTVVVAIGITLYYVFSGIKDVDMAERKLANGVAGLPSFCATIIFAVEGIGTIMPIENSLVKDHFIGCRGALNIAMSAVISLYASVGFFGYLKYGDGIEATITKNLPTDAVLAQVVQVSISLAVFFNFTFHFYVPISITWGMIKHRIPETQHNIAQILLRTITVIIISGIAAAAGHHLDSLIDLIGAIFISTLGLFIPCLIDSVLKWNDWGVFNWILYKNIFIMSLSLFILCTATYSAIRNMITS